MQKWAAMLVETGKAFVDPSAMMTQMREDSDFWSLPALTILCWRTHLVITKHPEEPRTLSHPSSCMLVRLVFFPLSLCLTRWFWPDLMNGKHDHTIAVCVSFRSSGDLHVVQLPAGSWHELPRW